MRVFLRYARDRDGRSVTQEVFDNNHIPAPRVNDQVVVEGRPRQVSMRRFFYDGTDPGPWDNNVMPELEAGESGLLVFLIG